MVRAEECGTEDLQQTPRVSVVSVFQVMSNPVDVAKTRLMNQKAEEGKPLLLGHVPCSGRGLRWPCVAGLPNFTPESVRLYRSTVQTMSTIAQQAGKLSASDDFGVSATTLDMLSRRDLWPCTRVFRPPLLGNALTRLGEVSVIVLNFFFCRVARSFDTMFTPDILEVVITWVTVEQLRLGQKRFLDSWVLCCRPGTIHEHSIQ